MSIGDCGYCNGEEQHEKHNVCPRCENAGFDGQGKFMAGGTVMYQRQCWDCGLTFAVQVVDDE